MDVRHVHERQKGKFRSETEEGSSAIVEVKASRLPWYRHTARRND